MSFLPCEMEDRMYELEDILAYGQIKPNHLREILDIYNTACLLAEEMHENIVFKRYIKKMQDVFMNENVIKILKMKKVRLESPMTLSVEEKKKKIDKIKELINQRQAVNIQATKTTETLISNMSVVETKTNHLIQSEMSSQGEIFKQRLAQKRTLSNPHKKETVNRLKDVKENTPIRTSITNINVISPSYIIVNDPFNKPNSFLMSQRKNKPKFIRRRQASVIYENKYEGRLEELLMNLWNSSEKITKEEIMVAMDKIYTEMNDKYLKESMNIILKYNNDIKDIDEEDLKDSTNVNVIIYKKLIDDRDNELKELKERIDNEKKEKMSKLREETFGVYDKVREVSKVKIDVLHELIKENVPNNKSPNEKSTFYNPNPEDEEDNDNEEFNPQRYLIENNSDDDNTIKNERVSRVSFTSERISRQSINEVKNIPSSEDRDIILW